MILRVLIFFNLFCSSITVKSGKSRQQWTKNKLYPTTKAPKLRTTKLITITNSYTGSTLSASTGSSSYHPFSSTAPTIRSTSDPLTPTEEKPANSTLLPTLEPINRTTASLSQSTTFPHTNFTPVTLVPTNKTLVPTNINLFTMNKNIASIKSTINPINSTIASVIKSPRIIPNTTLLQPTINPTTSNTTALPTNKSTTIILNMTSSNTTKLDNLIGTPVPTNVECVKYRAPDYGILTSKTSAPYYAGDIMAFFCDSMFLCEPKDCPKRTCQGNGTWSGVLPKCIPDKKYNCPEFVKPENSYIKSGDKDIHKLFDVITLGCTKGFTGQGNRTAQCNHKKLWDLHFQCGIACPVFVKPENSYIKAGDKDIHLLFDVITLGCIEGYTGKGNSTVQCNKRDTWNLHYKCCKSCPNLTPIDNNDVKLTQEIYCVGDQIRVQEGGPHLTCMKCEGTIEWTTGSCEGGGLKLQYIYIASGIILFLLISIILIVFIRWRICRTNKIKNTDKHIIKVMPLKNGDETRNYMERGRRWSQFSQFSASF